jgi:hypothetical protein
LALFGAMSLAHRAGVVGFDRSRKGRGAGLGSLGADAFVEFEMRSDQEEEGQGGKELKGKNRIGAAPSSADLREPTTALVRASCSDPASRSRSCVNDAVYQEDELTPDFRRISACIQFNVNQLRNQSKR